MPKKFQLNPEQKTAVECKNGSYLVVAGAGTGKTRIITERIKNLIEKCSIEPHQILALTFTEKAASEMVERLDEVMPLGYMEPYVCTFHSFAERILRYEALEIGLDPYFKIASVPDQWILFRKNIFKMGLKYYKPLGNPTKFIGSILKFISRLQDEDISPEQFETFAIKYQPQSEEQIEKDRLLELANIYKEYQKVKVENSRLDFGDLITWTLKLFRERPNILKKYQNQFIHSLVDEFQDTNFAQYEIIKLLCPHDKLQNRSLLVVGDDSQSIYKFRGAAVSNILDFIDDYPKCERITLNKNYRSGQDILDYSYNVIQNNNPDTLEVKLGISKKLISSGDKPKIRPEAVLATTLENEVDFVIEKIKDLLNTDPSLTYKDFAILARANGHLDAFILALKKENLPYQLVGNRGLYDQEEIRNLLAILKILINTTDHMSIYRALNIDAFDIPSSEITKILSSAKYKKVDIWDVISESENEKVIAFRELIVSYQEKSSKQTPTQLTYELVKNSGYLNQYTETENSENQLKIKNLDIFLGNIKKFEIDFRQENKIEPTLIDYIEHLELTMEAGDNPAQAQVEDIDTINLMTVHASKGLEFEVVFLVNLVSDRFPTRDRKDPIEIPDEMIKETLPEGDPHLQEERRLFYVGMTRAKSYLFLTSAKNYGGKRDKHISGYLTETKLNMQDLEKKEKIESNQKNLFGLETKYRLATIEPIKDYVPDFLSYTQVSTYEECALKYKYSYVLKIPTPPSASLSYGSSIHDTLRDFHNKLRFENNVEESDLMHMFEKNWQPLGYLDAEHRNQSFKEGQALLHRYYEKNKDSKIKPKFIEQAFNVKIDGVRFYGRIDRIDELEDGSVEIIDYKTGKSKTQKEVDKDDQMSFYAIAAKEALNLNPTKLTLYFVEDDLKLSTTRTEDQLQQKKEEVVEVIQKIKTGEFPASPGLQCSWCDYKDICPFAFKG